MIYTTVINDIAIGTPLDADTTRESVERNVRRVIDNGFIHNRILIGDRTIFTMSEFCEEEKAIRDAHKTWKKIEWAREEIWLGQNKNADGSIIEGIWVYDCDELLAKHKEEVIEATVNQIMGAY